MQTAADRLPERIQPVVTYFEYPSTGWQKQVVHSLSYVVFVQPSGLLDLTGQPALCYRRYQSLSASSAGQTSLGRRVKAWTSTEQRTGDGLSLVIGHHQYNLVSTNIEACCRSNQCPVSHHLRGIVCKALASVSACLSYSPYLFLLMLLIHKECHFIYNFLLVWSL